jgi:hypothetical protein
MLTDMISEHLYLCKFFTESEEGAVFLMIDQGFSLHAHAVFIVG